MREIAIAALFSVGCILLYLFAKWAVAFCAAFFVAGSI